MKRREEQQRLRTRRAFLKCLTGSTLALPFMSGLLGRFADAAVGVVPPRVFFFWTGNGQYPDKWRPSGADLTQLNLPQSIAPLNAHKNKLLLMSGINARENHHNGTAEALTGRESIGETGKASGGPSLDQLIAARWKGLAPIKSLELGINPINSVGEFISYSDAGLPVPNVGSPGGAFDRLFRAANEDPSIAAKRRAQQRSVLDSAAKDMEVLKSKLDAQSRTLLDAHLTLVRGRENELLQPVISRQCEMSPSSQSAGTLNGLFSGQFHNVVTAFRCDVTRVMSLRVGGFGGEGVDYPGEPRGHHGAAHEDPPDALVNIQSYHAQQFAALLAALDAVVESNETTLLDNTLVVWAHELGLGPTNNHGRDDLHMTFAGGAALGMANGKYFNAQGAQYAPVLHTVSRLVGLNEASFGTMKNGAPCTSTIAQMFA